MDLQQGSKKIILVDPDNLFAEALVTEAAFKGVNVDHYKNMTEIGYLGRFKEYDVAILNERLDIMTGLEIAEYFDKLLGNMPMILLHKSPETISRAEWPKSVFSFISKNEGANKVLQAALRATSQVDSEIRLMEEHQEL